jgi:uncharacterized membrane protein
MNSRSKFVTAVGIWCLLIVLAPLLMERAPMVSFFLYLLFSPICHQLPERSFFILGHQFAVCARCTGIYFGAFLGSFLAQRKSPPAIFLFLALVPMAVDGGSQLLWRESNNVLRFVTGAIAGFATIFYVYAGLMGKNSD